jgi:putative ABC transport system permease protein
MLKATLKSLLSRKLRLILSGLAVVLGVMFVSGTFVLTDTLGRSFDNLVATVYDHTDVVVTAKPKVTTGPLDDGRGLPGVIPAATIDRIRTVPVVSDATGHAEADGARVISANGKVVTTAGAPRIGASWLGEQDLVALREGRGPTADNEIAVNASLAKAAGIKIGDQVGVLTLQPKKIFTLVGIFGYSGGRDSIGGAMVVSFTEPVAQQLMLGQPGVYSEIDVKAAPGVSETALRDRIATTLGDGYQVRTGTQMRADTARQYRDSLQLLTDILLGFAGIALFVGIFLILNTFSIMVAQRTRELALMRAIGASRRQMIASVLVEAVAVGSIASALGLGAGIGVGTVFAYVFTHVTDSSLALVGVGVPAAAIISAFSVGIVVTVVAALLPAARASRIPPIAALQQAATPDRPLTKVTFWGAAIAAAGGTMLGLGLAGLGTDSATMSLSLGGVLLSFIGSALLTPIIARPLVNMIGGMFSWSVPGKLGSLNSGRNPRRTAITAAALMVGLALITGVNVVLDSATKSLHHSVDREALVDLVIAGDSASGVLPTFDPKVLDETRALPGVRTVVGQYVDVAVINGQSTGLTAITDLPAYARLFRFTATEGTLGALGPDQVVTSEQRAQEYGLHVGDTVRIQLPRGEIHMMTLSGIYARNDLINNWLLPASAVTDFRSSQPNYGYIQVADRTDIDTVHKQVATLLADSPEVNVANRDEYVDQQAAQMNTLLTMIQILLALAILIAVLGVINTLALSVLERTRELGLLRAIGLSGAQAMAMVTVEAVVISVFGALLGIAVGSGLGASVVRALHGDGITELAIPWERMGVYLVLAALVGVVAAVLPAIRAAKVNVLDVIAYE